MYNFFFLFVWLPVAVQAIRGDRKGCSGQLREGLWTARRHCRRHRSEQGT